MPTTNIKSNKYSQKAADLEIYVVKDALEANGFKVEVVENLEEARDKVLSLVPEGSEVFTATSKTLTAAGLDQDFNESNNYVSVRAKLAKIPDDKPVEKRRLGSAADYSVGSVHAITEDGQVLVASASGSQLPGYVYGASHVIWVVGSQKIVKDLAEGLDRIENYAFHLEDERAQKAYGIHSSINKILIYRKETQQRVTVVLIKEAVGF